MEERHVDPSEMDARDGPQNVGTHPEDARGPILGGLADPNSPMSRLWRDADQESSASERTEPRPQPPAPDSATTSEAPASDEYDQGGRPFEDGRGVGHRALLPRSEEVGSGANRGNHDDDGPNRGEHARPRRPPLQPGDDRPDHWEKQDEHEDVASPWRTGDVWSFGWRTNCDR